MVEFQKVVGSFEKKINRCPSNGAASKNERNLKSYEISKDEYLADQKFKKMWKFENGKQCKPIKGETENHDK